MNRVGWLKPGLGVKRWLLLTLLGAGAIALGALSGVRALAAGAQLPDPLVQIAEAVALRDLNPMVRAAAAAAVGLVLVGAGLIGLARAAILPYRTDRPGVSLLELLERRRRLARGRRVVVLGGGTGLGTALRGLKLETAHLTAIVSMGDDGGSSGVLREQLGIPPVGDLRNCLVALSDSESTAADLLRFRLPAEPSAPRGHAIGNLLLAAAIHQEGGDLERGVARVHRILNVRGEVIPGTTVALELIGTTTDGATFSEPVPLHGNEVRKIHYTALAAGSDGQLLAAWLDNRGSGQQPFASYRHSLETPVSMRVDAGTNGKGICPCCDMETMISNSGDAWVAYRHSVDECRDIHLARRPKGADSFQLLGPASERRWKFQSCPHDGPSLAQTSTSIHVAWMDAADQKRQAFVASGHHP